MKRKGKRSRLDHYGYLEMITEAIIADEIP